jgi:glycerate kinase
MKIVLAPDSFKGSLSAIQVCDAMQRGILHVAPDAKVIKIPLADGGEGTVRALVSATGGVLQSTGVVGPLGEAVEAEFGLSTDGETAFLEMAAASGLELVPEEKRNPLQTTSYGTGQLISAALERGCRKIIIGLGGSATTDGGSGMAQALGVRFFDWDGKEIADYMNGERMGRVHKISTDNLHRSLRDVDISAACDVDNPLLGPNGAVAVYSQQKGATPQQKKRLERNMRRFVDVVEKAIDVRVSDVPGAGAAGGLGAALLAFTGAVLRPGIGIVLEACDFSRRIAKADIIFTGEGKVDQQTAFGKTISGVVSEARKQHVPVIVVAGQIESGVEMLYDSGVTSMFSICEGPVTLEEALQHAGPLVENCMERIMRVIKR